jgi:CzcA family heavy metal efflux pump
VIGWSIDNRALVFMAALALMVVGIVAADRASLDALPDFTPPQVVVQIEARGMTTHDVEQLVTRPIERALLGTPETTSVRSMSGPGLCVVTLAFRDGVDVLRARQFVTERLQLVQGSLPAGVSQPELAPIAAPVGAVLRFCVSSSDPDPAAGLRAARRFADWSLQPRLLAVPGVSQVIRHGGTVERLEVRPDAARMRLLGVGLHEITQAVQGSQAMTGGGFIENAGMRADLQTNSRLSLTEAPRELAQIAVGLRGRTPIRIGDVAEVAMGDEPAVGAALFDGRPAVFVQVMKLPWADTPSVTQAVETALRELQAELPKTLRIEPPVFRQASFIATSLTSVGRAMLIGSLLVLAVLFAFLRHGRLAFISLTAIPLSVLAAVTVLSGMGASINAMTLGGLAIAVGEGIDDAIVDVENVWRRLRENAALQSPRQALVVIREASREIRSSVVYATSIVVIVLVPVLLLGGIAGRIFSPLALAYCLAILASLVVALTVTPALCAALLPGLLARAPALPVLSTALLARYRKLLAASVRRPRAVFGCALLLSLLAVGLVPFLGGGFLPEFHESSLIGQLNAGPGTSLPETLRLAAQVDGQLRPAVATHVAVRAGRAELGEDPFPVHRVEMDIVLQPHDGDFDDAVRNTARAIARVPGVGFAIESFLGERIHETLAGDAAPIVVKVIGPDLDQLRAIAADVGRVMERTEGLEEVGIEPQIDVPEVRVSPRHEALARFGVRPLSLGETVALWRQGVQAGEILGPGGQLVKIAVVGPESARGRDALADLPIETRGGAFVPLSALANIDEVFVPAVIHHEAGERRISIGADAPFDTLSRAASRLSERLAALRLPVGYRIEVGGEAAARGEAAVRLLVIGGLVLLAVFAMLAGAFSSLADAGIVLLNIPLGLIGGVFGALLSPDGLSVAGLVGFVTLFGIVARNGIMVVAHKRHWDATRPELDAKERVLRAAEERLLPILMTAAAAGLCLLPLALSGGAAGSEIEAPMALIVIGGLVSSTALNAIVLPTVYVWLEARRART